MENLKSRKMLPCIICFRIHPVLMMTYPSKKICSNKCMWEKEIELINESRKKRGRGKYEIIGSNKPEIKGDV